MPLKLMFQLLLGGLPHIRRAARDYPQGQYHAGGLISPQLSFEGDPSMRCLEPWAPGLTAKLLGGVFRTSLGGPHSISKAVPARVLMSSTGCDLSRASGCRYRKQDGPGELIGSTPLMVPAPRSSARRALPRGGYESRGTRAEPRPATAPAFPRSINGGVATPGDG